MVGVRRVFYSAAAVCSDQPLAVAAAFTLDRKDARRKDAHCATRHSLDSHLLSQSRIKLRKNNPVFVATGMIADK